MTESEICAEYNAAGYWLRLTLDWSPEIREHPGGIVDVGGALTPLFEALGRVWRVRIGTYVRHTASGSIWQRVDARRAMGVCWMRIGIHRELAHTERDEIESEADHKISVYSAKYPKMPEAVLNPYRKRIVEDLKAKVMAGMPIREEKASITPRINPGVSWRIFDDYKHRVGEGK